MEAGGKRTAAVIVRGHMESEKLTELAARLHNPDLYDLYAAVSHAAGPMVVGPYPQLVCDLEDLHSIGFMVETRDFFYHIGDAVLYLALSRLSAYDYYIMLEHDVDLSGDAQAFILDVLHAMAAGKVDLAGPWIKRQKPDWGPYASAARRYAEVWSVFLPILAVSGRAVRFLYERRMEEAEPTAGHAERVFCEAWVASELRSNGYEIRDLNVLLPGSCTPQSFYYGAPVLAGSLGANRSDARALHPVYPPAEFLRAHLDKAFATRTLPQYMAYLSRPHPLIPDATRERYRARANEDLAYTRSQERTRRRSVAVEPPPVFVSPRRPAWPGAMTGRLSWSESQDLGRRPVIRHVCDQLQAQGVREIVIAGLAPRAPPGPAVSHQPRLSADVAGVRSWADDHGHARVMVCYGDCLSDVDIGQVLAAHQAGARAGTVVAVQPSPLLLALTGDVVPARAEPLDLGERANGGYIVLEREALNDGPELETVEALLVRLHRGDRLTVFRHEGFWECVQTSVVLDTVRQLWADGGAPWAGPPSAGVVPAATPPRKPDLVDQLR
jgi:hypothetical protein